MSEAETGGLPEAQEPVTGLDAVISGALDQAHYGEESPVAAPDTTEETPTADGRVRDAQGRFAPKEPAEPEAPKGPAEGEAPPEQIKDAEPVAIQPIEPPARWSEEDKAKFAALPREAQSIVSERAKAMEADYTRKTQEVAETRKSIEPVLAEFQRADPLLRHMNMTPQQFVTESVNVATNLLSSDPSQRANAIAYLVQHRQVPLPELLNALGLPPATTDGTVPDPVTLQLHQTVTGLQQQLRQIDEQRKLDETQRAKAEFDAIGQTKDDNGQPKFPHFQRVANTMIQLVATNQADTWDSAYSKAVRLDDELFKQTVEAERTAVAANAEKARLEAVEKAKKAAPVRASGGSPRGASQVKGLDAVISAAMESHNLN